MGTNLNPQLSMDFSRGRRNAVSKRVHAEKVVPRKEADQKKILFLVGWAPEGLTLYEAAEAMNIEPHCISGRFSELGPEGQMLIKVSGKRPNKKGNPCGVYFLTDLGKQKVAAGKAVVIG